MCFCWTLTDGFGPLWICGTKEYHQECQFLESQPLKPGMINTRVVDPESDFAASMNVDSRKIKPSRVEVPDECPYPPPFEFTWQHYIMLTGLQAESTAIIDTCYQVASRWTDSLPEFKGNDGPTWPFAPKLLWGIWVLEDLTQGVFVDCLRKTAKKVLHMQRKMMKEGVDLITCASVGFELMDNELQEMRHQWTSSWLKRFCIECGIVLGHRKCFKCSKCSVRYCSEECQRNNWEKHKQVCRSRRETLHKSKDDGRVAEQSSVSPAGFALT